MRVSRFGALALGLATGVAMLSAGPGSALPLSPVVGGAALSAQFDRASPVQTIQFRRRGRSGAAAAGIIGGLIVGGIIASQQPRYYYGSPYGYYPAYRPYPYYGGRTVDYCMRRFKSYDPYSMTYLGFDGFRHPCP